MIEYIAAAFLAVLLVVLMMSRRPREIAVVSTPTGDVVVAPLSARLNENASLYATRDKFVVLIHNAPAVRLERGIMLRQGVGVYTAPHVVVGRDLSPQEEQIFAAYSAICRDMSMKQCIDELWRRLSEKTALVYDVKPVARDIVFAVQVDRSKFLSLMFSKAQLDAQLIINAIQLAERLSRNYRAMQTVLRFLERSQAARLTPLILLIVLGFVALLVLPQLLPALQQAFGHILPAPR